MAELKIETLTSDFSQEHAERWLRGTFASFSGDGLRLDVKGASFDRAGVTEAKRLGYVVLARATDDAHQVELPVFLVRMARMGMGPQRKAQFACAKQILKGWGNGRGERDVPGALFFFHAQGRTRLSLVTPRDQAATDYKRQSFLLVPEEKGRVRNQTFRKYFDGSRVTCFGRPGEKVRGARSLLARFSVEALTKEFYTELFAWYEWAAADGTGVRFPDAAGDLAKTKEHLIRLITRLMFVWFVHERGLVPDELFDAKWLGERFLRDFDPAAVDDGAYYNAVLQNLFFATLNQPVESRRFADGRTYQGKNASYGVNTLFRDKGTRGGQSTWFKPPHEGVLRVFAPVPYLNGGLFECLDGEDENDDKVYRDGFSRRPDKRAFLPNALFFDKARGLLPLFGRYDFTIDENHATDADIALDPELLGKVFENLLASYNPETGVSARKASGSFYTPREIVDYMVDQSLRAALAPVADAATLDILFGDDDAAVAALPQAVKTALRDRLKALKTIDPACGSGAFPMGLLNRMVGLLADLGEQNTYQSKLHLIEQGIYGVDIQPIAIQISKLRFFISLLCDQTPDPQKPNAGLDQLPNLETHLVIANSLIGFQEDGVSLLEGTKRHASEDKQKIVELRERLIEIRRKYVLVHSRQRKTALRQKDEEIRKELQAMLKTLGFRNTEMLAEWNPYDPTVASPFFDPQWMFGLPSFDIVIGNPPYVVIKQNTPCRNDYLARYKALCFGRTNIYQCFFGLLASLLSDTGVVTFIHPKTLLGDKYLSATRKWLLNQFKEVELLNIVDRRSTFANVLQSVIVTTWKKQGAALAHICTIDNKDVIDKRQVLTLPINRVVTSDGQFLIAASSLTYSILDKVSSMHARHCAFETGKVQWDKAKKWLQAIPAQNAKRLLFGENIQRYSFRESRRRAPYSYITQPMLDGCTTPVIVAQRTTAVEQERRIIATVLTPNDFPTGFIGENSVIVFPITDLNEAYFILGVLNSRFVDYFFRLFNSNTHVASGELNTIPIPIDTNKEICNLVATILDKRKQAINTDTEENVIDAVVYRLYGLTAEEIELVEASFMRRAEASRRGRGVAAAQPVADDDDEEEA